MDSKKYWDDRYAAGGTSGYGSYGEQLDKKLRWIFPLRDITTITEVGCGDFNFGMHLCTIFPKATYYGLDISPTIIERNRKLYPKAKFATIDPEIDFPPADLLLCVDVLFHIMTAEETEALLQKLEKSWTKYLVITAYERDEEMNPAGHVRIRKFDYKRFGEPIVREIVEEDGSLYFYIYDKTK